MFALLVLAADAPAAAPAATPGGQPAAQGGMLDMLPLFAIIFFIFYFLVIRPQSKEKRKREALLKEAKKGDKIVTTAGIHGRIVSTDDATVLVEVDDGVRLRFDRAAVWQVKSREGDPVVATVVPEAAPKKS